MDGALSVAVIIDYQNIHLTARDVFAPPGTSARDCLIHPVLFADHVMAERAAKQGDARQRTAELRSIIVFRGQPSNSHQKNLYGASRAQATEWSKDGRADIRYRPLKYPPSWPTEPAREKGIDVLLAITLVKLTMDRAFDVIILATHDTDLEPAIEMAATTGRAKIETAGWDGCRRLRVPGRNMWHTTLSGAAMVATRDRRSYFRKP